MAYQFLEHYRWSPNGYTINDYPKGSKWEELPEKLIIACEKESYPLLKVIKNEDEKADKSVDVKIEPYPENKIEPDGENKTKAKGKRKKRKI